MHENRVLERPNAFLEESQRNGRVAHRTYPVNPSGSKIFDSVHFGGPDLPAGNLRNLLEAQVDAVPAGGSIDWVTYYFRDRPLAAALLRAHSRGVRVSITLAGQPRTADANADVISMLTANGLGEHLRTIPSGNPSIIGRRVRPRLHAKIYCFSHPQPIAYVGSFNPSDDEPETRPDIIAEIGAHRRAWNALVGITEPTLVAGVLAHARRLHDRPPGPFHRFTRHANRALSASDTRVYFWPRVGGHPIMRALDAVSDNATVRMAASHLSAASAIKMLIRLARRGVNLTVFTEPTFRRVTPEAEQRLLSAGVNFARLATTDDVPMHLKFVLVEDQGQQWMAFGSFNWTIPSLWLNHEIAVVSHDPYLFRAFERRWQALEREARATIAA
jgi:phosphatidylserine/phosphatidylglycerophosphate/cardiolipin synthase-like enzyme